MPQSLAMDKKANLYVSQRYPIEITRRAVWFYVFSR